MFINTVLCLATLLLPSWAIDPAWDRPLDYVYALEHGKALPNYTDEQLWKYFEQVKPGITSMVPFFLNVANPGQYNKTLAEVRRRNIVITPAVGAPTSEGALDQPKFRDIAKAYKPYSDYIRLEGIKGYYDDTDTRDSIQSMINYCVSLGFKHIMLNPWPLDENNKAVPYKNKELDSTIFQVLLDKNNQNHRPINKPTNWYPHSGLINATFGFNKNIDVLINYESAPQQEVLAEIEHEREGASEAAMQITIDQIDKQYSGKPVFWIPPFDKAYDPIALNTWDWIAKKLSVSAQTGSSNISS